MRFIALVLLVCAASACAAFTDDVTDNLSDDVIVTGAGGVQYRRRTLQEGVTVPNMLNVDYSTDDLYFRLNLNKTARLNLNTRELKYIEGISSPGHIAFDQDARLVYIGSTVGLYQYQPTTDAVKLLALEGTNVWNVVYKGVLYYTVGKSKTLYTFNDGKSTKYIDLDDKVERLYIYNNDIIYYSNDTVLYKEKKGAGAIVIYKGDFINGFSTDRSGRVYFSTSRGIYEILNDLDMATRVFQFDHVRGVAFDNANNIIYSDLSNIYRLTPVDKIQEKIAQIDTRIDYLEKKVDRQLSDIFELLQRTVHTACSPHTVHLDLRNVPVGVGVGGDGIGVNQEAQDELQQT